VFYLTRAAWPHLKASHGFVVNTASLNARMSFKTVGSLAQTTAKAGIIAMTTNETAIRKAYQVAEDKDIPGWVDCFAKDGTFCDESIAVTYRGAKELGRTVEV
jgi:hypothetical protein